MTYTGVSVSVIIDPERERAGLRGETGKQTDRQSERARETERQGQIQSKSDRERQREILEQDPSAYRLTHFSSRMSVENRVTAFQFQTVHDE